MTHDVMAAVTQRFNIYRDRYLKAGRSDESASREAAHLACLNRAGRRKFLGRRGPNRDLPRTMAVPRGKR